MHAHTRCECKSMWSFSALDGIGGGEEVQGTVE